LKQANSSRVASDRKQFSLNCGRKDCYHVRQPARTSARLAKRTVRWRSALAREITALRTPPGPLTPGWHSRVQLFRVPSDSYNQIVPTRCNLRSSFDKRGFKRDSLSLVHTARAFQRRAASWGSPRFGPSEPQAWHVAANSFE
jgi:hypothetical protein